MINNSFEYSRLINFIHLTAKDKQLNLIDNIEESSNTKINLINITDINELVKVFQSIIMGVKPYILNLKINSDENIIEKLQTLIAINYQNLTEKHIETLIGESDSVFVSVNTENNAISSIKELYFDKELYLEEVYSYSRQKNRNTKKQENAAVSIENKNPSKIKNILIDDELMSYKPEEHVNNVEKEEDNSVEIEETASAENTISSSKINKYKLLKEKVKARKSGKNL